MAVEMPLWVAGLAERVRIVKLPTAQLADAMRAAGEDPHDEALWQLRMDQLDTILFGVPIREMKLWRPRQSMRRLRSREP
jgi:hypothetical protein